MTSNEPAPILLFVYQRPDHTRRTLEALKNNDLANLSTLYIYSDGPKDGAGEANHQKIQEVRKIIREKKWCKEVYIIESTTNKGLANSIISGVSEKVNEFGKVIVLEDDLLTSKGFLKFMNNALDRYLLDEKVMQISGFQFPLDLQDSGSSLFLSFASSWGWATWKRAWNHFDPLAFGYERLKTDVSLSRKFNIENSFPYTSMLFDQMEKKNINSWAIRWWWSLFTKDGLCLFPDKSLIKNIGYGADASHTSGADPFSPTNFDSNYYIKSFPTEIEIDLNHTLALQNLLKRNSANGRKILKFLRQCKSKLNQFFKSK